MILCSTVQAAGRSHRTAAPSLQLNGGHPPPGAAIKKLQNKKGKEGGDCQTGLLCPQIQCCTVVLNHRSLPASPRRPLRCNIDLAPRDVGRRKRKRSRSRSLCSVAPHGEHTRYILYPSRGTSVPSLVTTRCHKLVTFPLSLHRQRRKWRKEDITRAQAVVF
ncbi:hypothetical protein BDZ91DRAFT_146298 [Kalaharituber pfeilii]|nr:hypothetical protein BDZ91DRAFT_146298 [Kalaharituber pfeilii]